MYLSVAVILIIVLILDVSEFIISLCRNEDNDEEDGEQLEDYH